MPAASKRKPRGRSVDHSHAHLRNAQHLRQAMDKRLNKCDSDSGIRLGNITHADKVKTRAVLVQTWLGDLGVLLQRMHSSGITLRRCVADLKRQAGMVKAALSVCNKRIELRGRRPRKELFHDQFDEALWQEQVTCLAAQEDLSWALQAGQEFIRPMDETKTEMQASRLTCHTDRAGTTDELIIKAKGLLQSADQYCTDGQGMLEDVQAKLQSANEHTGSKMKKKVTESYELRNDLETEVKSTRKTIAAAELHLKRVEIQLAIALAAPERDMDTGGDGKNEELSAKTGVLANLRSKIRAAAYVGAGGRDMGVCFQRFDRDRSGELDEDEIRIAIRKACKIPPSVISDVEIVALCELLDEDGSGAISIAELVDFLLADVNVEDLTKTIATDKEELTKLKQAEDQISVDCIAKAKVWRINEECVKTTPVKGLELDTSPAMHRLRKAARKSKTWKNETHEPGEVMDWESALSRRKSASGAVATVKPARRRASTDPSNGPESETFVAAGPSKVRESLSNAVAEGQLQAAWQTATMLEAAVAPAEQELQEQQQQRQSRWLEAAATVAPAEAPGASMMPIPHFSSSRSTFLESGSLASTPLSGSGPPPAVAKSATLRRPDETMDVLMNEDERLRMSRRLAELKEEARQFAVQDAALESTAPVPPLNALSATEGRIDPSTSCIRNLHQYFIFPQGMDERSINLQCSYNSAGPLPSNLIGT